MTKVMRKAYTEVDAILKYMPKEYVDKVPQKFRRMFNDCKLNDYEVNIDPNKSINEQKVVYETLVILTILKYNYWCKTEEEKKIIEKKLRENDLKSNDMYDFSKLNARKMQVSEPTNELSNDVNHNVSINLPVKVENKSWFLRLISKIKNLFKR